MTGQLLVVLGAGTDVGKTHLACSILLWASSNTLPLNSYKPVESGPRDAPIQTDAMRLANATVFHVKPPPTLHFSAPLAPAIAASLEGVQVPTEAITATIAKLRAKAHLLLELPGGAFSPFDGHQSNAQYLKTLPNPVILLVLKNQLGVLSDATAYTEALRGLGLAPAMIVLNAPSSPDESTPRNPHDLKPLLPGIPVVSIPRGSPKRLQHALPDAWLHALLGSSSDEAPTLERDIAPRQISRK